MTVGVTIASSQETYAAGQSAGHRRRSGHFVGVYFVMRGGDEAPPRKYPYEVGSGRWRFRMMPPKPIPSTATS